MPEEGEGAGIEGGGGDGDGDGSGGGGGCGRGGGVVGGCIFFDLMQKPEAEQVPFWGHGNPSYSPPHTLGGITVLATHLPSNRFHIC